MKIVLNVFGAVIVLVGGVWVLQGVNILRQSVMSGHRRWVVIGAGLMLIGAVILILSNRGKKTSSPS